jgi:exodeoxyribonuclease V beta subunit
LIDRRDGRERNVAPGDITVLVPRNDDATRMQRALAAAGIPCVAAARGSVYATAEAVHLAWLLEALLAPADEGRLRAVLASPLFGLDANALAALDTDLDAHRTWQDRLQRWLARARRHGPMALVGDLCAAQAPRLLAEPDGERRLANYLQLAEDLQAGAGGALGLAGVLAELQRRIEAADPGNDAEGLRLETDAARVRILTLHVSKGLTLDLVFVPYAATTDTTPRTRQPALATVHADLARVGRLFPDKGGAEAQEEARASRAEHVRLLYVGLTRARLATWVAWGASKCAPRTALGWLLHREGAAAPPATLDAGAVQARLETLAAVDPEAIALAAPFVAPPATLPWLALEAATTLPPARQARRVLDGVWSVSSFSQLARETGGAEARGAEDELDTGPPDRSRFAGPRFGNALHAALEHVDFAAWRDWREPLPPPQQLAPLLQALRDTGYATAADRDEGVPLLTQLVAETLNAPLPEGTRLCDVPPHARVVELEFHLAFKPATVSALLATLHAHGVAPGRTGFGARARLAGLLTGRIDLVYAAEGRHYIVDYKSNRLPAYDAATLARAVRDSEYDLQYVLYLLALHRWLRFRLRNAYDPARHLGGVRYLFCRGLDREDAARPGVHAPSLPLALLEALDAQLRPEAA